MSQLRTILERQRNASVFNRDFGGIDEEEDTELLGGRKASLSNRDSTQPRSLWLSFTTFLTVAQVILYIVIAAMGGIAPIAQNPVLGPTSQHFLTLGASSGAALRSGGVAQSWRLLSSTFMFSGLLEMVVALVIQVPYFLFVEQVLGGWNLAVTVVVSGVCGALFSAGFAPPQVVTTGALASMVGVVSARCVQILVANSNHDTKNLGAESRLQRRKHLTGSLVLFVVLMPLGMLPLMTSIFNHVGAALAAAGLSMVWFGASHPSTASRFVWMALGAILLAGGPVASVIRLK